MSLTQNIVGDCRFVLRSLRRSPRFTTGVVGTIALCMAANAAVLSSLYSLIVKPLPFADSDRLVQVMNVGAPGLEYDPGGDLVSSSRPSRSTWTQYRDFADHATLLDGFAFRTSQVRITAAGPVPVSSPIHGVSAGFFELMKVQPLIGRFFSAEEVDPGPGHVIVLTERTWRNDYGADPSVLGRVVRVGDGVPYTVIGVAPRSMETFDFRAKYFIPYPVPPNARTIRVNGALDLWARLKDGVSRQAGLAELQALENRWYDDATPEQRTHHDTFSDHLAFGATHPLRASLILLQGAAALVLLVGALNVLTLLLARANHRSRELAVRIALGARTPALGRLMVIESAVLAVLGLGVGSALTAVAVRVVNARLAILEPSSMPVTVDAVVVAAISAVALCGVCIMGLLPLGMVLRSGNRVPENDRSRSSSVGSRRLAGQLVMVEVAFAFTLLIGAGLLVRSFYEVSRVRAGFDAGQVARGMLDFNTLRTLYPTRSATIPLKQRILDGMQSIPGMQAAALAGFDPVRPNLSTMHIEGTDANASSPRAWLPVSAGYFETMGLSIIEGRPFDAGAAPLEEVIVDENFARRYLGGRSPVGIRVMLGAWSPTTPWARIVGVVGRANLLGREERDGAPVVYTYEPASQGSWTIGILVRSTGRMDRRLLRDVQATLREIDPRLPVTDFETFEESLQTLLVGREGITMLLGSFAVLALLVAMVGLYAVLSLDVERRRREIGIRIALGASRGHVIGMVLRQGLARIATGLGLGIVGGIGISAGLRARLFDVAPFEPWIYGSVAGLLLLAGLVASSLPAWRAAGADAMREVR